MIKQELKAYIEACAAIDRLIDELDCRHDYDCPYTGNHKGALDFWDGCGCWMKDVFEDIAHALDIVKEKSGGDE